MAKEDELNVAGIYRITETTSGKNYVGSAINIKKRWQRHTYALTAGAHENQHLQRSWVKNGSSSFEFKIIEIVTDNALLFEREQHWLDELQVVRIGFNILQKAGGGRTGIPHSEETKVKISESKKGHTYNLGRKHPPEYGEAISKRQLGTKMSEEAKLKMSLAKIGKKRSQESKDKIKETIRLRKEKEKSDGC